jgi:hypothetical protein
MSRVPARLTAPRALPRLDRRLPIAPGSGRAAGRERGGRWGFFRAAVCIELGICRWGDYSGASPDPGASQTGTEGHVWLTQMWSKGGGPNAGAAEWGTWNWQATP